MDGFTVMQLIKTIFAGLAALTGGVVFFLPLWYNFSVEISWDGGRTTVLATADMGLFFMYEGYGIELTDMIFLDKATNAQTGPPLFRLAQIFYGIGITGMFICTVASAIYTLRKYKTATGELCLAGGMLPSAISLTLGVVFAALAAVVEADNYWEAFPVPGNFVQVQTKPIMEISYGLFIAAGAALFGLVALVMAWLQACAMCRHVENVRYHMLFAPLTDDERGVGIESVHHFVPPGPPGKPKKGFRFDGDVLPDMSVEF
ncbi:hypothetical protein ACF0H5_023296 [Mactra antiquata]